MSPLLGRAAAASASCGSLLLLTKQESEEATIKTREKKRERQRASGGGISEVKSPPPRWWGSLSTSAKVAPRAPSAIRQERKCKEYPLLASRHACMLRKRGGTKRRERQREAGERGEGGSTLRCCLLAQALLFCNRASASRHSVPVGS